MDHGSLQTRSPVDALTVWGILWEYIAAQHRHSLQISSHERTAILHLWMSGAMTMSELGSRIPLSRAAMTALADRLEQDGLVRRIADAHDRRRTLLALDGTKWRDLLPSEQPVAGRMHAVIEEMGDEAWLQVAPVLDRLARALLDQ